MNNFKSMPLIHSAGATIFDPIWSQKMHQAGPNEFLYIKKGSVSLELDEKQYTAHKGDFLLVPKQHMHRDHFDINAKFETFMVSFTWAADTEFFSIVSNDLLQKISKERRIELVNLLDLMRTEVSSDIETDKLLCASRFHTILLLIYKAVKNLNTKDDGTEHIAKRERIILQAKDYVNANYDKKISLDDVAEHLGVSPFYLSRVFSSENNFSLFEYLLAFRMEKAKHLLGKGKTSIAEVALSVGYDDSGYFSKVFKKYFGKNPSRIPLDKPEKKSIQ